MKCQVSGCTNIGVHSCSSCGTLVCGMHGDISGERGQVQVRCSICRYKALNQSSSLSDEEERGCMTVFYAFGLFGVGIILLVISQFTRNSILAIIGLVAGGLGVLLGIIGAIMLLMEWIS